MRDTERRGSSPALHVLALTLVTGILLAHVPAARADEGLYLTWNDCALAGSHARTSTCVSGVSRLFCAFTLALPVDQVIGVEAVVDVQVADTLLPPFWQLGTGGCRQGSLTASENFTGDTACVDPWHDTGVALIQDYQVGQPRGGSNQARIEAVVGIPSAAAATLSAGPMVYAIELDLDSSNLGLCAGCATPACLVLNSIWLRRLPGAPGGDVLLQTPGVDNGNWATWQGASVSNCQAVPVRRATWGRVRSLYR